MNSNTNYKEEFPRKENVERQLDYLYGTYCPLFGPSKTYGGELVRAMNRVLYRWQTERKKLGFDIKLEKSSIIMHDFANRYPVKFEAFKYFYNQEPCDDEYEYIIYNDLENFLKVIFENPEIFQEESDFNIDE